MRIEQLKYFLEVAQLGSINAAAQHVFISQQGISDALKKMEQEWGVTLLKRSKIGVSLTAEGEEIYTFIKPIIEQYTNLENYLQTLQKNKNLDNLQAVRILTNPLSMTVLIPDLLELLERKYPSLKINCIDVIALDKMLQQIQDASADLCIFMLMQSDAEMILQKFSNDVQVFKLFEDELVACVAIDSRWGRYKSISNVEFSKLNKVLCSGAYTSQQKYTVEFISNNIDFQLKLILKKKLAGVTIRHFFQRTFPNDVVSAIPIKPALKITYYIMLPCTELSWEVLEILKLLEEYILDITGQVVEYHGLLGDMEDERLLRKS